MLGINFKSGLILLIICVACGTENHKNVVDKPNNFPTNSGYLLESKNFSVTFPFIFDTVDTKKNSTISYVVNSDSIAIVLSEYFLGDSLLLLDSLQLPEMLKAIQQQYERSYMDIEWTTVTQSVSDQKSFEGTLIGASRNKEYIFCRFQLWKNQLFNLAIRADSSCIELAQNTVNSIKLF